MNNAEIIKGIDMTIEGLTILKSALSAPAETPVVEDILPAPEVSETPAPVYDEATLKAMKFNEFKKLASSLGVKCTGTRDEIMERILALNTSAEAPAEVDEEKSAEAPVEKKGRKSSRSKKSAEEAPAETSRDEFDEQAEAIAEDTDVEDIIEALADVDIKATKKNAVTKLAEALRNGLIELDDEEEEDEEYEEEEVEEETEEDSEDSEDEDDESEDEEESDEDDEEEDEDGEEISADSYFSEYDPEGFNDPDAMTEERKSAIEEQMAQIISDIDSGDITSDDVDSFLEDFATDDEKDLMGDDPTDDDFIKLYMELHKRFIDNDGEAHEPSDPYEVGEEDFCCGHPLKYVKKTKKYVCEHCGAEYESE